MPSSTVRIRMRTLTSHASQTRSSNVECILSSYLPARRGTGLAPSEDFLAGQLGDHGKQWHVQPNYDAATRHAPHGANNPVSQPPPILWAHGPPLFVQTSHL